MAFHYYNEELDKMNLRKEKGSPRTFNVEKLKQKDYSNKKRRTVIGLIIQENYMIL